MGCAVAIVFTSKEYDEGLTEKVLEQPTELLNLELVSVLWV